MRQLTSVNSLRLYALPKKVYFLVGELLLGRILHLVDYRGLGVVVKILIHYYSQILFYGLLSIIIKNGEVGEFKMFILVAHTLYLESEERYSHIILPSASPSA